MTLTYTQKQARANFPAGLQQPEGSYRFGLDALLLAAYSLRILKDKPGQVVELGCGCGAAILAFAMMAQQNPCLGIDFDASLLACAQNNAAILGVDNIRFLAADITKDKKLLAEFYQSSSFVFANPPWRQQNEGRISPAQLRRKALWANEDTLTYFCKAAVNLLKHRGFFCCILHPEKLTAFFDVINKTTLGLREILPVANTSQEPACRVLLACQKNAKSLPQIMPPLVLRQDGCWTEDSLAFCPWLK